MGKAKEIVFEERKNLVDTIIKDLENGNVPFWRKGWNTPLPENLTTNNNYKGLNLIRLNEASEIGEFKDNRWVTFNQAKTKGYKIKKGSKGSKIEFWGWEVTKTKKDENGKDIEVKEELTNPIVRYYYVYNAEQIENFPEKDIDLTFFRKNELIENIIKNSEAPIVFCSSDNAYYMPSEDKINMPNREYFLTEDEFYHTILHEIAHSTGHKSRLNRKKGNKKGSKDYAIEELIAELTSMFLQQQLGIEVIGNEKLFDNHKAYLEGYIKVLKETPNILFKVIREAEKAADYVINMGTKKN